MATSKQRLDIQLGVEAGSWQDEAALEGFAGRILEHAAAHLAEKERQQAILWTRSVSPSPSSRQKFHWFSLTMPL